MSPIPPSVFRFARPVSNAGASIVVACLFTAILAPNLPARDESPSPTTTATTQSVVVRGDLNRSRKSFVQTGKGRVAFLGGSITEMNGYRPMVARSIRDRFENTEFQFTNAGIASTCSHTGAFRFPRDVLAHNPDLLFIEFAVNDDQDAAHSYRAAVRGMEGIVRAAKLARPEMDMVITHFVNPSMLATINAGKIPVSIRAHETVARHYGITTCNVAVELADQIKTGRMTWKTYGGVHPKPAGNRIAADLIESVFEQTEFSQSAFAGSAKTTPQSEPIASPIDASSFFSGRILSLDAIAAKDDWIVAQPDWETIPGQLRSRFDHRPLITATRPGAEIKVDFNGTAIGVYVLAGPDAGTVEYSIDEGPWKSTDLYHRFSKSLHYPRTVVLQSGLPNTEHQIRIRVSAKRNDASDGHAVRVIGFVAS